MKTKKYFLNLALGVAIISSSALITFFAVRSPEKTYDPSVAITTSEAFSQPLSTLNKKQTREFILGKNLFHGISNDNRTLEQRGIGPLFNASTCGECHANDGTGDPNSSPSLLIKIFNPDTQDGGDPTYGIQIQQESTFGIKPEANVDVDNENKVNLTELSKGKLAQKSFVYQRISPPVFGMGLIEAIPDSFFKKMADPSDKNKDGISGRIPYIYDEDSKTSTIGKFGWKSTVSTVKNQTLLAAFEDIGLTNSAFKVPECSARLFCLNEPDMTLDQENNIVSYVRSLAPPRARTQNKQAKKGEKLFTTLSCSACHTQSITLEKSDLVVRKNTVIHPMSDLLLHSMGPGLSDGSDIYGREADEFRTAPLWGLGLKLKVNGSFNLLHDGRAKSIEQAIMLHGGEANDSKKSFVQLSATDKKALVSYLNTL